MLFVPRILNRACDKRELRLSVRGPDGIPAGGNNPVRRLLPNLSHPPPTLVFTKRRKPAR